MSKPLADKLWNDEAMHAAYKEAFDKDPDVHHWALLCWIRDDMQQALAAQATAHAATLAATLAAAIADERRIADDVMVSTLQQARKAYGAFISKLEARITALSLWQQETLQVLERGVELMPLEQLGQWDGVGAMQHLADAPEAMVEALQARIARLEDDNHQLSVYLADNADPELLTIAYGKGYSDAQDKARQQIAELEAKCLQLEARSINLGMTDEMQRNELAEKDNLIAELTAQLAECNKSLDGHVWAYSTTGEDPALEDEAFAALEEGEECKQLPDKSGEL